MRADSQGVWKAEGRMSGSWMAIGVLAACMAVPVVAPAGAAAMPDLTVAALSVEPSTSAPGGRVDLKYAVRNEGDAEAGACKIAFYYSNMQTLQADAVLLATADVPALAAGAVLSNLVVNVRIPNEGAKGMRYLGAVVDYEKSVSEASEYNTWTVAVTIDDPPDLRIASLDQPSPATQQFGGPISVTFSVVNAGKVATPLFVTRLYYSDDSTITTDDTPLDFEWETTLAANISTNKQTVNVVLPSTAKVGSRFVGAIADADDSVFEGVGTGGLANGEANNTRAANITITVAICYGVEATEAGVCGGHGTCVGPDMCECDEGWAGDQCGDVAVVEQEPDAGQIPDIIDDDTGAPPTDLGTVDTGTDWGTGTDVDVADVNAPDSGVDGDVLETDAGGDDVAANDATGHDDGEPAGDGGCGQSGGTAWPVGVALMVMAAAFAGFRRRMA